VVNVASDAHRFCSPLNFDDLQAQRRYRSMRVYGHSKLANLLFTHELARRLQGTGVTVNAMHPGFVGSALGTNNGRLARIAMRAARPFVRTPEQGAETAVWLCAASEVRDESGGYFRDRRPHAPRSHARDDAAAERLWAMSERLAGLG
jgi:NAD(P)-dependent dehydrogenase (short-subunit alcohol dehydrogenase family)